MSHIALFHSVLGIRPGVHDAADRLRADGHQVLVADLYNGRRFDDYAAAGAFAQQIGYPELMRRALHAVQHLPDGLLVAGFSNGAAMAEHVATHRRCTAALLLSGALPLAMIGAQSWPAGVPVQIHYARNDPFRRQDWLDDLTRDVRAAPAPVEVFDYPGAGHLFTDPSLTAEYDQSAAELCWQRALDFCHQTTG